MVLGRLAPLAARLLAAIGSILITPPIPAQQQSILSRRTKSYEERAMSLDRRPTVPKPADEEPLLPADDSRRTYSISVPWTNENNEQLAAISGDRTMTVNELRSRIRLMEQNAPPIQHPNVARREQIAEERRVHWGEQILEGWAETATLAQESEIRGYKATEQEIQESIAKLMQPPPNGAGQSIGSAPTQGVVIPLDQLRAETRDSILIEKFINDVMKTWYDDAFYRRLFEQEPSAFLIPPRVRAFHVFRMVPMGIDERDQRRIRKEMEDLRKELRKKSPDLQALEKKSNSGQMISIGEMGWVSAGTETVHPDMHTVLFGLRPGDTSSIFETFEPALNSRGLHVVRVLEREEGTKRTLQDAMPQLLNYTFGKTKHLVFAQIGETYDVSTSTGGLMRTRQVTKAEFENHKRNRLQVATPSSREASPAAKALDGERKPRPTPQPFVPSGEARKPPPVVLDPALLNPNFRGDRSVP